MATGKIISASIFNNNFEAITTQGILNVTVINSDIFIGSFSLQVSCNSTDLIFIPPSFALSLNASQ